ncbi:hypothetical protein O5699_04185 [Escherichia coli]|nr:hypothetical protein [Escherichia coli]
MSEIQFDTISGSIRKPGVHFEFNTRLVRLTRCRVTNSVFW